MTTDPEGARAFYEAVVGWRIEGEPSGPIDYRVIAAENGPVAELLPLTAEMQSGGARPAWFGYLSVDDVDATATSIREDGGNILLPPSDTPGVGRMAFVADPQGVPFYIMKPTSPADAPDATSLSFSSDIPRICHCAWNELSSSDPTGALRVYGQHFGWVKDGEMEMGPMGKYEFLSHAGRATEGSMHSMIGAVMPRMAQMPVSAWTYYLH